VIKKYLKNLFTILMYISGLLTILVFITGKVSLSENISLVTSWIGGHSHTDTKTRLTDFTHSISGSDNLVTTILKTAVVVLAIIFLSFATFVAAIFELVIWVVSWGDNSFYCTKEIWSLCWNKIVTQWYWMPASNTYLWITFLLYSGFFGTQSPAKNQPVKKSNRKR